MVTPFFFGGSGRFVQPNSGRTISINWRATPGASPFNSLTFTMEAIHLISLGGLAVILTLVCLDEVISVSRRPTWSRAKVSLQLVDTIDRRQMQLPFIGVDRLVAAPDEPSNIQRAAA